MFVCIQRQQTEAMRFAFEAVIQQNQVDDRPEPIPEALKGPRFPSRHFRCCEAERSEAAVQREKRSLVRHAAKLETSMTGSRDKAVIGTAPIDVRFGVSCCHPGLAAGGVVFHGLVRFYDPVDRFSHPDRRGEVCCLCDIDDLLQRRRYEVLGPRA
jgi:hypothetical protein